MDFACPACGKVYTVDDPRAVAEIVCQKCGANVAVPERPVREILYGVPLASDSPAPEPPLQFDERDGYTPSGQRGRAQRRQRAKRGVFLKLLLLVLFLAGIAVCVVAIRERLQLVEQGKAKFR